MKKVIGCQVGFCVFQLLIFLLTVTPVFSCDYFNGDSVKKIDSLGVEQEAIHFWDGFNFQDQSVYSSSGLLIGMRYYLDLINKLPVVREGELVIVFLKKSEVNSFGNRFFCDKLFEAFSSPNSIFRSDYVVRSLIDYRKNNVNYSKTEKQNDLKLLSLMSNNQVGYGAEDFVFTTRDGKENRLYNIGADHTLIYFFNPDCENCQKVSQQLKTQPVKDLFSRFNVKIIAVYIDYTQDKTSVSQQLEENWIYAVDVDSRIKSGFLYDIRAIPTIYLLDENKKVLLKDAKVEELRSVFEKKTL